MCYIDFTEAAVSRKTSSKITYRKFKRFAKKHPILAVLILVVSIIAAVFVCALEGTESNNAASQMKDGMYVHYIDVGQGDAELICCGGEYMLIDGGDPDHGDFVAAYLRKLGIRKLDYLVCTHGDSDHCGGLDGVLEKIKAETVFVSPYGGDKPSYGIFLKAAEKAGCEIKVPEAGESYALGDAVIRFIGPVEDMGDENNNCLVLRAEYGDTDFLFTGDMGRLGENALINGGAELKCDVLKVAHHGSSSSTGYYFLRETAPSTAVISCGRNNAYGHPHESVLSRLKDAEVTVYRTDLGGDIIIFTDGHKIERKTA